MVITPTTKKDLNILTTNTLNEYAFKILKEDERKLFKINDPNETCAASIILTIRLKDEKNPLPPPIGKLNLSLYSGSVYVECWLDEDHVGENYVCEAIFKVCPIAFNASDVKKMYIDCPAENEEFKNSVNLLLDYIESTSSVPLSHSMEEIAINSFNKISSLHYFQFILEKK